MLSKAIFDLDAINAKHNKEHGMYYSPYDHKGMNAIIISVDRDHEWWKEEGKTGMDDISYILEHQDGVYESNDCNFSTELIDTNLKVINDFPNITIDGDVITDDEYCKKFKFQIELLGDYGVADNLEQVLEYYKAAIDHKTNKFVIALTPIRKSTQPENDGWRWCKWGRYIGTQNPQCEYIADEPEIEKIYCFHIYQVEEV